jgi:hypothetical protein
MHTLQKIIKIIFVGGIAVMSLLVFSSVSQAQSILWETAQDITADTDVSTSGTYFDAATFYGSVDTVNTVSFSPLTLVAGSGTDNTTNPRLYTDGSDITITTPNGSAGAYGPAMPTSLSISQNYSNLTSVIGFGYFVNGLVTISNLTPGAAYQVQAFSYYTPSAGATNTTYTGTTPVTLDPVIGQYAVGLFTPTGTTETFNYDYGADYGVINAVSVRELVGVPEPSSIGLIIVAMLVFSGGFFVRQNRSARKHLVMHGCARITSA